MKYSFKYFILFTVLFSVISCKTSFYSEKVTSSYTPSEGIVYALPKSKLTINAELTKIVKRKGIFSDYTHLYFNAKNAIDKDETKYYISDVSLKTVPVTDSSLIFKIVSENVNSQLLNLSKESFISGINLSDVQAGKVNTEQNDIQKLGEEHKFTDYADISLSSVRETKYDTIYKEVLKDSVMIKVPVIRKKKVYKSTAKQAKETADIIFQLRDDRYALLTGENDGNNFPDGNALQSMLKELSDLEKNYMSLFTGKEIKYVKKFSFDIIPDQKLLTEAEPIFYFSETKGITEEGEGYPVMIKLYKSGPVNTDDYYVNYQTENKENKFKGIVYRLPCKTKVAISYKNKELYKTTVMMPQYGKLNIIPASLFKESVTVEFYPDLGSLKRISLSE